jgi:hypothetical protein
MRKSLFILLALLLMSFSNFAQGGADEGSTGAGSVAVEFTGSPFNAGGVALGQSVSNGFLSPGVIRARFFLGNVAIRLGTWVYMYSTQSSVDIVENSAFYSIRPGFEYKLGGNNKVSTYIGLEGLFENRITSMESTSLPGITGATNTNGSNRGFWQAGAMAFAGADYHFNSRFYFGVEVGLQYAYRKNADVILSDDITLLKSVASHNVNAILSNTLRLGFIF